MLTPEISEAILRDHYRKPRHRGACEGGSAETAENPACGDVVTVSLAVTPRQGQRHISCARFEGAGCAVSQAGASLVLGMIQGMEVEEARLRLEKFCAVMESGPGNPEEQHAAFGDAGALVSVARFPARVVCATLGARLLVKMLRKPQ